MHLANPNLIIKIAFGLARFLNKINSTKQHGELLNMCTISFKCKRLFRINWYIDHWTNFIYFSVWIPHFYS